MAGQTPNNVRTQRMIRLFKQDGGASPNNPLTLEGIGYGYSAIKAIQRQVRGGVTNISVRRPDGSGFQNVGSSEKNPGFDTFELDIMETIAGIPLASVLDVCPQAFYEVRGYDCDQLSDHLQGYAQGYVKVFQDSVVDTSIDNGDGMAYTDDNPIEAKIKFVSRGGIFDHAQIYANQLATANATGPRQHPDDRRGLRQRPAVCQLRPAQRWHLSQVLVGPGQCSQPRRQTGHLLPAW
jgi:hypothetical protein